MSLNKNMKNKKLLIFLIVAVTMVIIIVIISKSKENVKGESLRTIPVSQIFELENIEKSNIEIEKSSNEKVASKYAIGTNTYVSNANVVFGERKGKIIFLREAYNKANIFQTKYRIDELDSIQSQVGNYMESFTQVCVSYLGIDLEQKPYSKTLYGQAQSKYEITLEESIYLENRLYSITYKINANATEEATNSEDGQKYDINFYRDGTYLICEFVKIY